MKKFLFVLVMSLMSISINAQSVVKTEDGKKIKFNTMMEVLDYMGKRGWSVKGTYYLSKGGGQNVVNYLLEKEITNNSEKTEGIILRDDKD